jgi:hypothetical protein
VNEDYDEGGVVFKKTIILTGSESAEDVAEIHKLNRNISRRIEN